MKRIIAFILLAALLTLSFAGCGKSNPLKGYTEDKSTDKEIYYVAMAIKNHGIIIVELDAKNAPITVANFIKLVRQGFYDGLTFHRVIENFMIQGGDPEGTGLGGSPDKIFGEFVANGFYNPIRHERGTISMARSSASMGSASSQFFICNSSGSNVSALDNSYAAFGHVVEGMDVVDSITEETAHYGDANGTIANKNKQAVILKMMVIEYDKAE